MPMTNGTYQITHKTTIIISDFPELSLMRNSIWMSDDPVGRKI